MQVGLSVYAFDSDVTCVQGTTARCSDWANHGPESDKFTEAELEKLQEKREKARKGKEAKEMLDALEDEENDDGAEDDEETDAPKVLTQEAVLDRLNAVDQRKGGVVVQVDVQPQRNLDEDVPAQGGSGGIVKRIIQQGAAAITSALSPQSSKENAAATAAKGTQQLNAEIC